MSDETFASAVMKKLRDLETERLLAKARQPRLTIDMVPHQPRPLYNAERRRFELPVHLVLEKAVARGPVRLVGTFDMTPEGEATLRRIMEENQR